jgi:hypothetical protein
MCIEEEPHGDIALDVEQLKSEYPRYCLEFWVDNVYISRRRVRQSFRST